MAGDEGGLPVEVHGQKPAQLALVLQSVRCYQTVPYLGTTL